MDNRVIAGRYEIIDTLFSNEIQDVYSAKKAGTEDSKHYIVNEFKDTDTIYSMKDNFSKEKCRYIRNIVETFYEDFCFYVVCNICSGPTMETYLSNNNLRLTEKMYLTESLLTQLIEIEILSPFIVYSLCDTDNLAVTGNRKVCFNCSFRLTTDIMSVTGSDISKRVGEIICAIFSNTASPDYNSIKNNMPPALLPIAQNCLEGKYETIEKLYSDFKSLLLYSVFMGGGSVDTQIRKNFQKAKVKRRLTPLRRLAALIIILLLAGGVWTVVKDLELPSLNRTAVQNTIPTAHFTADKGQVFEGDTVIFTSDSYDNDADDSITSYLWVISREDIPLFSSKDQNISYVFAVTGEYGVHLVVTDSQGGASEPYKTYISVLPRSIAPDDEEDIENDK